MKAQLKILLLEDSPVDAELIQRFLLKEKPNCIFNVASSKKTYLLALDQFLPDIILSDHSLPQFDSTDALTAARSKLPGIPFIMVTGTVSEEFAANIIKQGADDYILKDRLSRLPAAIDAAVRQRRTEKEKADAAEKLRRSEENYRTIMERVSDGFIALDKEWRYTYVNKNAGEIINREPNSLVGRHIWTEFPEDIDLPFYKAYYRAMETQEYIHLEEYYPPFDAWLENHIYPSPAGLSIFLRNITDRKKAEQKIIQSEENLKAIFDNSSEGFILLDENGGIKVFNNKAGEMILRNIEENVKTGRSIFDFVEEQRKPLFKKMLSKVMLGNIIQYDRLYIKPGGNISWINFAFSPVRNNNTITGICAAGRDITEKKIAEQQKEFDHNNLHALINNTRDLMWSIDRDIKLITFNHAFTKIVRQTSGIAPERGNTIPDNTLTHEQLQRYKKHYERAFAGESFTEIEHTTHPVEFWSEISFYPIYEKQIVIGTACFSRNITEQKKAEVLLKKSFTEKQALAKKMSAILNTLPANIALLDEKGFIAEVNDAWRNFTDKNGFIGSNYSIGDNYIDITAMSFDKRETDGKLVAEGVRAILANKKKEFVFEYPRHSQEIKRWFRMVVTPLQEKEYTGAVVMHIDISELRRLEQERLESKMDEQKKITRAILTAQEKERHDIGIELHDNVNQILAATNLLLSLGKGSPERAQEMISESMKNMQEAIQENRKIVHVFVVPDLKTGKLVTLLTKLLENMLGAAGMQTTITATNFTEDLLDGERKINIYRVAQEQCTNILKYAKASTADITLAITGGHFKMIISDNGVGMDPGGRVTGIGLSNINGRISLFNGTADIITSPGKGFTLKISIPL